MNTKHLFEDFKECVDKMSDEEILTNIKLAEEHSKNSINYNVKYHLLCPNCNYIWWSYEAFPDKCPNCVIKL